MIKTLVDEPGFDHNICSANSTLVIKILNLVSESHSARKSLDEVSSVDKIGG